MSTAPIQNGTTSLATVTAQQAGDLAAQTVEQVLLSGDINRLNPKQKVDYYNKVCDTLGLNPYTCPFEFIMLNGKMRFYATKACTEQLRKINGVSVTIASREEVAGCYIVTAKAVDKWGRTDESIGAVPIENLKGESRSNAMMKAETKAKRRVTLSICGLGLLDESEVDSIPGASSVKIPAAAIEAARAEQAKGPATQDLEAAKTVAGENSEQSAQTPSGQGVNPGADGQAVDSPDLGLAPTPEEIQAVRDAIKALGWAAPKARSWAQKNFGVSGSAGMTKDQCASALALLQAAKLDDNDDAYCAIYDRLKAQGKVL